MLDGLERHMLEQMGWQSKDHSVRRAAALNRPEPRKIGAQRLHQASDECTVLIQKLHVPLSRGRISGVPLFVRIDEDVLDHAVSSQQVDAIQIQLWIGRYTL